jgi:hypothetical protein
MNNKYLEKIIIKAFDKPKQNILDKNKTKEYYDKYIKYKKKYLVSKQ